MLRSLFDRGAFALAACTLLTVPAAALAQKQGGTIRVSINSDIRSTAVGVNRDANTDGVMMHIVEGLVGYREDGAVAPMLAESVSASADGKTYTFKLRTNVKFHNGAPMTSADVVASMKRWLDPATKWLCLADFDGSKGVKIESVDAPDAATVVMKVSKPEALFLTNLAALHCGQTAVLHKDSWNPDGSFKAPVATGPYKMGEWKRGEFIEIDAFREYTSKPGKVDGYAGAKMPYADKVRWIVIKDDAAARAALVKGQIDILPGLSQSELADMGKPPELTVKSATTMGVYGVLIQTKDPVMANVKMRKALALALDLKPIAEIATGGTGVANASVVPVVSPYHSAEQKKGHGFDLARVKQLLQEAGYKGETLKMQTNRRYPTMYDQSVMVQSMAKKAGINIELEVLDWPTQLDRYQKGNYQLSSFGYSARVDPAMSYEAMLGDKVKSPRKVWDNPQAIALYDEAMVEGSHAKRQAIFDRMHAMMLDDVPMIVLFNPGDSNGMSKKIEGYQPWPLSRERLFGVWRN
jgi:peptide/nickel transport system substrate-binding protein